MSTTAVEQLRKRWTTRTAAIVTAAVTCLIVAVWWFAPWASARPITVTGTAYADADQTAIGFSPDSWIDSLRFGLSDGMGFDVESAAWASADENEVHAGGGPVACLAPAASTRIEISYVEIAHWPWDGGGPMTAVTFIRCLE